MLDDFHFLTNTLYIDLWEFTPFPLLVDCFSLYCHF